MRTFKYALFVGISLLCITPKVFAEDPTTPQDIAALEQKANQGEEDAQYELGMLYKNGFGVQKDYMKAIDWLTKAADQGDVDAPFQLARIYQSSSTPDYEKAAKWYIKAADQGEDIAQKNLGEMYENGLGVPQDYTKAIELYTQSAKQGNAIALMKLGVIYENGNKTIPQDKAKAKEYYKQACLNKSQDGCDAYKRLNDE